MKAKSKENDQDNPQDKESYPSYEPDAMHLMNRRQRREMTRKIQSEEISLEVVHRDAAGIDIGNELHYVSVPPSRDSQPVRHFGCTTAELKGMAEWPNQCRIRTVAYRCIKFLRREILTYCVGGAEV